MSITVRMPGAEPVEIDCYTYPPDAGRGHGTLYVDLPSGTMFQVDADEGEAAWPQQVRVSATREDTCVEVRLEVAAPNDWPMAVWVRWAGDSEVIRVPAGKGAYFLLDGVPRRQWGGFSLEHPGGPEHDPAWQAEHADPTLGAGGVG